MNFSINMKLTVAIAVACFTAAGAGCTTLQFDREFPYITQDKDRIEVPTKVVAIWTDAVLHANGEVPERGFGGRLHFYARNDKEPVKVAGTLVVYGFDEANRNPIDPKPDRKFVFPPDELAKRMSETDVGPSYNIWVPWGDARGEQKDVSLIVRFEPLNGPLVTSSQTRHRLPGTPVVEQAGGPQNTVPAAAAQYGVYDAVRQAGHSAAAGQNESGQPSPNEGPQMRTTTIQIPSRFGSSLATATLPPSASSSRMSPAAAVPQGQPSQTPTAPGTGSEQPAAHPAPAAAPGANPPAEAASPAVHSGSATPRVPGQPIVRPTSDLEGWQHRRVGSPFGRPTPPGELPPKSYPQHAEAAPSTPPR
ncbi:MAG: hypothetical protein WDZ59_07355 [Pirellulales bacterium]